MTNSTETYWEASGVSLHTEAWSLRTWGGGRNATVPMRGEDYVLPFREGRTYRKKTRDSRVMPLAMWILPLSPDGTRYPGMTMEEAKEKNWELITSLFDTEAPFALTKRWRENGEIKVAVATAELLGEIEPTISGGHRIETTIIVQMSDPWFYGDVVSEAVGTITVLGNKPTSRITLTLTTGQRVTTPDGNWVQYNGPGTATIDCKAGTAMSGGSYVNGLVTRNPKFPEWLRLRPGVNALTGAGTIAYRPAYK